MSDEEDVQLSEEERLLKKHRREKKDLQSKIQALKKTASKGDKKKKKDVAEEISKLEADLKTKHDEELANFRQTSAETDDGCEEKGDVADIAEDLEKSVNLAEKRVSKAQKRRDKKAERERERQDDIERQEEENRTGQRRLELDKIGEILAAKNLRLVEVPSNGDCMFAGIAHQLVDRPTPAAVRQMAVEALKHFRGEFRPFVAETDDEFDAYCDKMANTARWGGHVELSALSRTLKRPIEVVQFEGQPVLIGEEEKGPPVVLTYHKFTFGLGEHYNATEPK